jgi:hypothetical protein
VLERPAVREVFEAVLREYFRQGARGPTHDLALEARPWNIDLGAVESPVDVWHGSEDDRVSPASRDPRARPPGSRQLPHPTREGRALMVDHMREVLEAFT